MPTTLLIPPYFQTSYGPVRYAIARQQTRQHILSDTAAYLRLIPYRIEHRKRIHNGH